MLKEFLDVRPFEKSSNKIPHVPGEIQKLRQRKSLFIKGERHLNISGPGLTSSPLRPPTIQKVLIARAAGYQLFCCGRLQLVARRSIGETFRDYIGEMQTEKYRNIKIDMCRNRGRERCTYHLDTHGCMARLQPLGQMHLLRRS